jgi:type II secretory pathway predicted ATPase ExeA
MYKTFYKLQTNPFGSSPDPRFLYMMPHTREALAGLEYGISTRKGFMVLVGEVGTGKTTLLRRALSGFDPRRVFTSFVFNPLLEPLDFLEFVMTDFGIPPVTRNKSGMLMQLNRWLVERYRHQETCVVLVDEAQNLSYELFEEIRLLTNLETSSEKLLQIVLSGQPELQEKLRQPKVRQLRQRIAMWCRTQAITQQQTGAYIAQRLLVAGTSEPLFAPDAVVAIYRASQGIPRLINLICEHALMLGYVEQVRPIPAALIHEVTLDLDLDPQPFLVSTSQGDGHRPSRLAEPAVHASAVVQSKDSEESDR